MQFYQRRAEFALLGERFCDLETPRARSLHVFSYKKKKSLVYQTTFACVRRITISTIFQLFYEPTMSVSIYPLYCPNYWFIGYKSFLFRQIYQTKISHPNAVAARLSGK